MSKISNFLLMTAICLAGFACSSPPAANTNQTDLPPEFSNKPITVNGNSAPGIDPNNINVKPNPNGTPTPGIPDPANVNVKPNPKGTPTPGIPDEKTLKKMREQMMNSNVNSRQSMTDADVNPQPQTNANQKP